MRRRETDVKAMLLVMVQFGYMARPHWNVPDAVVDVRVHDSFFDALVRNIYAIHAPDAEEIELLAAAVSGFKHPLPQRIAAKEQAYDVLHRLAKRELRRGRASWLRSALWPPYGVRRQHKAGRICHSRTQWRSTWHTRKSRRLAISSST